MKPAVLVCIFLLSAVFSSNAFAQTLRVIKTYPGEGKVIVDQGANAGFNLSSQVDLLSESGEEVRTQVTKSTPTKSILKVPGNKMKLFKPGVSMTYAIASGGGDGSSSRSRKKSKSKGTPFIEVMLNPAGMIFSEFDGGIFIRITDNIVAGPIGIFYTAASVKGSGFGLEARYYLERAFNEWFIGLGGLSESVTLSDTTQTQDTVSVKPIDTYGMVGYNWAFSSMFQAELGAGVRYYMAESKFRTTGNPIYEFSNPLSGVGFLVRGALAIVF